MPGCQGGAIAVDGDRAARPEEEFALIEKISLKDSDHPIVGFSFNENYAFNGRSVWRPAAR